MQKFLHVFCIAVLNNDSVEFTEEYCPSDIMQALQQRGWVISADEQVSDVSDINYYAPRSGGILE